MNLTIYAQRLSAGVESGGKTAFEDLCFDIEYDQLANEFWPRELFCFVTDVLRDPVICSLPGSDAFVRAIYNDFEKLEPAYQRAFLHMVNQEADNFGNEILRHSVGDLIARKFDPRVALKLFSQWNQIGSSNRLHMAEVGLEVMAMSRRLAPQFKHAALQLLETMR